MLSLSPFKAYAGFGVSPSLIQEQRLVPGATIERTFYLIQGTPENSVDVNFTIESATAASWVTILDIEGSSLTIPEGVQQFPVKVKIQVPPDAPENIHRVFIRTNTIPEGGTGQVAIAMSAKLELELTVGDEIYKEFKIRDVQLQDIPVNGQPTVTVKIENTGNVPSGPDSATFELFNKFGDLRLAYAQIDGTIEEVPGFTEETVTVKFPLDIKIGLGEYWGTVKLYEADKLVREEKSVFRVLDTLPSEEVDVPSPENKATVKSFLDNSINSSLGRIVLGAFLGATLVLFIAFLLTRKRKK
jgi:hypothetical protein